MRKQLVIPLDIGFKYNSHAYKNDNEELPERESKS